MNLDDINAAAQAAEDGATVTPAEVLEAKGFLDGNPHLVWSDRKGFYLAPNVPAVVWWLEHPSLGLSHVRYNVLEGQIDAELLPWNPRPHAWTDADTAFLYAELQKRTYNLMQSRADMLDALLIVAHKREYDPLLDMLDALDDWDGTRRAETLLVDFLGAPDTPYVRAVTRHVMNGAVMRAYHPGCKFDEAAILVGDQGGLKSTFVRKWNMDDKYFTDNLGNIATKEASENLQGRWIIEIGELESLRKREVETVKQFVSAQEDRYRAPYARFSETRPRRCVFVGTTNSTSFLADRTGNRRFLPVACDISRARLDLFAPATDEHVKQAWAEILTEYRKRERLPLVLPEEVYEVAEQQRDMYSVTDPREGLVVAWVEGHCRPGERVCILQLLEGVFNIPRSEASKSVSKALVNEVSQMLDRLPMFERLPGRPKHSDEYGQQRCWEYRL